VQDLLDHLVGGTRYLGAALAGTEPWVVGPTVPVADDASAQDRLLAAMGRTP
jgi:hypothetical protein